MTWLIILSWICFIVFVIVTFLVICRNNISQIDIFTLFIGCALFFLIWNIYCYKNGIYGLLYLFKENADFLKAEKIHVNYTLYIAAIFTLAFSALSLIVMLCLYWKIKFMVSQAFGMIKSPTVISLASFAENLQMKIQQVSENYFQKSDEGKIASEQIDEENSPNIFKELLCTICYDKKSEVLIDPCGHSGLCTDCMTNCIKEKPNCPICRHLIEKVYILCYDQKTKSYMAKGVITFD